MLITIWYSYCNFILQIMAQMNNGSIVILSHTQAHTVSAMLIVYYTTHNSCTFVINTITSPWQRRTQFKTNPESKACTISFVTGRIFYVVRYTSGWLHNSKGKKP